MVYRRSIPRAVVPGGGGPEERSDEGPPEPGTTARAQIPGGRRTRRDFTDEQKADFLLAWKKSGLPAPDFAAKHQLQAAYLYRWRKEAGSATTSGRSKKAEKRIRRQYSPEEKRAAVETFSTFGATQAAFARLWGTTVRSLHDWLSRYKDGGPKALEPKRRGRPKGAGLKLPPPTVRTAIVNTKRRFPWFGLRKVRDSLRRFDGVGVTTHQVQRTLKAEDPALVDPPHPRRRKPRQLRRFERAKPNELWQTDITAFTLARHHQPVYLVAFLDDHSRFIVSWALALQQKTEFVMEALRAGIAKYGHPNEVLSDQGRQYYAWRGKSAFQKLLQKEGIEHVVSRAHHPETLGKCERFWETVEREFWNRRTPSDLDDARTRLANFIAHYNFRRPHQALDGLVPADRFFQASDASRQAIEAEVAKNALDIALGKTPRKPVFLYGQIGEKRVSLHGERGRIVVQTEDGIEEEIGMDELGGGGGISASAPKPASNTENHEEQHDDRKHAATDEEDDGAESGATHGATSGASGTGGTGGTGTGSGSGTTSRAHGIPEPAIPAAGLSTSPLHAGFRSVSDHGS